MLFLSLKYCVMLTVLKPVLMYDRNMQMHYANLPHCVANLHSYLLSGISIFQIPYLILDSFKGAFILLLRFEYTTYYTETTKRSQAASFLYNFYLRKFVTFCHWWSRNFLFCKGESGVPHLCPGSILLAKFASKLFSQFYQKRFKENYYQKSIEEIANFAIIAKVTRLFLANFC